MNKNFLLKKPLAQKLYHKVLKELPIIDYHNHLNYQDIATDRQFENITQLWVASDPYKHRLMRILGVSEEKITGNSSDFEKFKAWYEVLPRLAGNPLLDWSQMELSYVFDYELFPFTNVEKAWKDLNKKLETMPLSQILGKFNLAYIAPCVSCTDDLSPFQDNPIMAPSLRGDDMLLPTHELLDRLCTQTGQAILSLADYLSAIDKRLAEFLAVGCRFADHALDDGFDFRADDGKNDIRFTALLEGTILEQADALALSSYLLTQLGGLYAKHRIALQLHIGAQRFTSSRLRSLAGPAGGFAGIGQTLCVRALTQLLDSIEKTPSGLPHTLLFASNPSDNAVMATLSGSYAKDACEALVSQGPAWWWCDHYEGMATMLDIFATHSVLSSFIGMTTDSRSPLSLIRHDYFRRILCQWVAQMVDLGRMPRDFSLLSDTVYRMCYGNAKRILED